jgi:hypothetical protein
MCVSDMRGSAMRLPDVAPLIRLRTTAVVASSGRLAAARCQAPRNKPGLVLWQELGCVASLAMTRDEMPHEKAWLAEQHVATSSASVAGGAAQCHCAQRTRLLDPDQRETRSRPVGSLGN